MIEGLGVLVRGAILGFVIAAPVGPIGLLCIRRTLEHGPATGFATGLGAAVADTFYGALAAFGVQVAIDWLREHETAFQLIGGAFMLFVAIRGFAADGPRRNADHRPDPPGMFGNFATGLAITIGNPLTIAAFVAIFAAFGPGVGLARFDAATLVLGVFIGSASWWLLLNTGVAAIRHKISENWFLAINRTAAVLLAALGIYAVALGLRLAVLGGPA